jgi:hypothetical protein
MTAMMHFMTAIAQNKSNVIASNRARRRRLIRSVRERMSGPEALLTEASKIGRPAKVMVEG